MAKIFTLLIAALVCMPTQASDMGGFNVAANKVLAGPTVGGNGTATYRSLVSADVPTLNQNTTGTAANLSGTPALPNGVTATTQAASDNSTKLATTAYADNASSNASVISKVLTGFSSGAGVVAATDTILQAFNKIVGNIAGLTFSSIGGTATVAQTTVAAQAIGASAIDWSLGSVFTKTLGANTTFTFSNQTSGQTIVVRLTNTASNWTVTWPVGVLWSGGTAPTETVGAKSDVITFVYDGSNTYGSSVQNF